MAKTTIEWTDHSISPIRARSKETGKVFHFCERISPGCAHCYAATMAHRFGLPDYIKANRDKVELFLDESKLKEVLRRQKPTRFFWEDCSDLFGDWVKDEWLDKCFAVMAMTPQHTHQVLTKRPERMAEYMQLAAPRVSVAHKLLFKRINVATKRMICGPADNFPWPLPNAWLGVSVEDQKRKERIDALRAAPAAVRFLSLEPLLEDLGALDLTDIDWVIVGGESGPGARPCNIEWIRSIREQCKSAGVPLFVKQLGSKPHQTTGTNHRHPDWVCWIKLKDKKGGDMQEWPEDLRVREMPEVPHA